MQRNHLISHMSDVQNFEKNMNTLSGKWDLLTLLGSMPKFKSEVQFFDLKNHTYF
jgi:hypothetical protein